MKKRSIDPTPHTYSTLFSACSKAGPPAAPILGKIQDEIERRKVELNVISYNALISALAHCGMVDEAFEVYDKILQLAYQPTLETYSTLLVAAGKDRESGLERALHTWSEMQHSTLQPDLFSYNCLLQCLRDGGIPDGFSEACYHQTVVPPVTPDLATLFPNKADKVRGVLEEVCVKEQHEVAKATAGCFDLLPGVTKVVSEPHSSSALPNTSTSCAGLRKDASNRHCLEDSGKSNGLETVVKSRDKADAAADSITDKTVEADRQVFVSLGDDLSVALFVRRGQLRWLESSDIGLLIQLFRRNRWRLDIRTFHLLVSLSVDLPLLLRHMKRRKIFPDQNFLMSALWQRKKMGDREGAMVIEEHSFPPPLSLPSFHLSVSLVMYVL